MGRLLSITTTKGNDGVVVVHYHNQRKKWCDGFPLPQPKEKMGWLWPITTTKGIGGEGCGPLPQPKEKWRGGCPLSQPKEKNTDIDIRIIRKVISLLIYSMPETQFAISQNPFSHCQKNNSGSPEMSQTRLSFPYGI
jgi:hypothetical protein